MWRYARSRTFNKLVSWCIYFGIILIGLLQLNHSKICLFWDHTAVVNKWAAHTTTQTPTQTPPKHKKTTVLSSEARLAKCDRFWRKTRVNILCWNISTAIHWSESCDGNYHVNNEVWQHILIISVNKHFVKVTYGTFKCSTWVNVLS